MLSSMPHPSASDGSWAQLPLAASVVVLDGGVVEQIAATVRALYRIAHLPAFPSLGEEAGDPEIEARNVRNAAVMMGYDFHISEGQAHLIEINTNAGGALINARHTDRLVGVSARECLCRDWMPLERLEERIVESFREEFRSVCAERPLRNVALVDDAPESQFLRGEFELYCDLFRRFGIESEVIDTKRLVELPDGGVASPERPGLPLDLVYLRDTDFLLQTPRARVLRRAWFANRVVVTPSPREYLRLADKRRLVAFSDPRLLRSLGATEEEQALLGRVVPRTLRLQDLELSRAWQERKRWVFKPAAAFGSRAVYRGDKITRRKLEEVHARSDYVAQERVEPGAVEVRTERGTQRMKFDVRAYVYRDRVLMLGARVYQGQVTTMRTPGGGFSAVCVSSA